VLAAPDIHRDAEAAKIVFESGVPIMMVDLTACAQARFTRNDAAQLLASKDPIATFVGRLWQPYLDFAEKMGPGGAAIHDSLGVGIAIDPQIAKVVSLRSGCFKLLRQVCARFLSFDDRCNRNVQQVSPCVQPYV
jgi:inosine-uridine nucleoside N-ribohydrolase